MNANIKSWNNIASDVETMTPADGLASLHSNSLVSLVDGSPFVAKIIADSLLNTFHRLQQSQFRQRQVTETMRSELRGLLDSYSGSEVQQSKIDALQARISERDTTSSVLEVLEADARQLYEAVAGETWVPMSKERAEVLRREREAKAAARQAYQAALDAIRTGQVQPQTTPRKGWLSRIFG